jgi:hypothetical protein
LSEALSLALPLLVPEGYGVVRRALPPRREARDYFRRLLVWEPPRADQLYVVSVDIGDGIKQDRSVIDVTRVGTIKEPDEQVAQWVDDETDPLSLAPVVDCIGRLYTGADGCEALAAIEINNHGAVTQAELQKHLGYQNFFVWQVVDAADPEKSYTTRIGWVTTRRTRPIILARYFKKLKAVDPTTGKPDYLINSPLTIEELRTFRVPDGGGIAEACAEPGTHDDTIMAGAIGVHVASTLQYEEREPVDQTRRRLSEERSRKAESDSAWGGGRDYQNTESTADEVELESSRWQGLTRAADPAYPASGQGQDLGHWQDFDPSW